MKPAKQHSISVLAILALALAQFAYPQSAQAARLCNGVSSPIYFVDENSPAETPDGCSWETAYHTLQDALTNTTLASGNTIRVADGTYYPDEGAGQVDNDRNSGFLLKNGVSVLGGYAGYGATDPNQRDTNPLTNNTILSGDIDGVATNTHNAYHVVGALNINATTELSSFTIRDGNPVGDGGFGGGMYVSKASSALKLKDLLFTSNYGYSGAGLAAIETELSMTRVIFDGNTAQNYGGGFYNQDGNPTLTDVIFKNNQTQDTSAPGAGMHSTSTDPDIYPVAPVLNNVTFSNNTANQGGGGGMFNNFSDAVLTNVTFTGNYAGVRGGGMLNEGSNVVLNNVTFSNNTAPAGTGAAMRNIDATGAGHSAPVVKNTIFWETGGVDVVNDTDNTITIDDSVMQDAGCPAGGTCTNVTFEVDPVLSPLANNGGFTETMAIGVGGSAMDAGNNGTCATKDQRGVSRPQDGDENGSAVCDIGAYEFEVDGLSPTATTITADNPDPSIIDEAVTVSVTVSSGTTTPEGTVSITGANTNCTITLSGGSGSCNVNFTFAGGKSLVATYNGDTNHAPSVDTEAHTVLAASSTTNITSDLPDPSAVGETVTVNYTVTSASGTPTGNVTVTDGVNSCVGTVAEGSCSLALTTAGNRTLTATYAGSLDFASSSDTESHTVNQANTTTTITSDVPDPSGLNQAVTVNFTVVANAPGGGTPTGNVTVTDGVDTCVGTVAEGSCEIALSTLGARTLTATYGGDSNFVGSVSTGQPHMVNEGTTTTTITSDLPDPSAVGQAVTVNYTVTSTSGTPTGNVTVTDGVNSCVGTVAAGNCKIILTTVGARILTASYAGDANFGGSISVGVAHKVVTSNSKTLRTIATHDGWILETSETSNRGGARNNTAPTFYLGDDGSDRQYRAILSFSTKELPDTAVITSITLKVKKQGVVGGGNPISMFRGFHVDVKKGFFGTSAGLQGSDFQTKPNQILGPFKPALVNGWYSINLTPAKGKINLLATNGGVTQVRLRFKLDDNNNNVANYLSLFSGNAPLASRPKLIIQYYVP